MRDRFLHHLARVVLAHPRATVIVVLVLLGAASVAVPGLQVVAGHSGLVDSDDVHQARFHDFLRRFGSPNLLFAMVEGGNERLRRQVIDDLIVSLPARVTPPARTQRPRAQRPGAQRPGAQRSGARPPDARPRCDATGGSNHPGCVRDVMGRIDLDALKSRGLLYLSLPDLKVVVSSLQSETIGLKTLLQLTGLDALVTAMAREVDRRAELPPPTGAALEQAQEAMSLASRFFREWELRIKDPKRARISLEEALFSHRVQAGIDARGYLSATDGRINLAMIRPLDDSDEPSVVMPFVRYVRRHGQASVARLNGRCTTKQLCPQGPLRLTLTGLPAIITDETQIVGRDVTVTTLVAISGILALFIFGFRSVRQTVFGLPPLLIGLVCTLAFVHLVFGALNLVTAAFIATLLGLGIDFAVHLLSRFNESRATGAAIPVATRDAILGAGPGILTGAFTTAGAFIALAVNEFMAFSQLGIITGVGLLFVLLTTLTLMPAMLVLPSLRRLHKPPARRANRRPRVDLPGFVVRHPVAFVLGGIAIAGAMLLRAQQIPWSYNYIELMPRGLDSVKAMETLARRTDFSAGVAAVVAGSPQQAETMSRQLRSKPTISRTESIASFIPDRQQEKHALLQQLKPLLQRSRPVDSDPIDLPRLDRALQQLADSLEDARFEAKRGGDASAALLKGPIEAIGSLRQTLKRTPVDQSATRLAQLQKQVLDGLDQGVTILRQNVEASPITADTLLPSLHPGLRDRLYAGGQYAIYAYPARPIWEKNYLEQLVADLRSVSPTATGFPVTHWESSQSIERGFRQASLVASVTLLLFLLIDFRSLRFTLLALAPLALGIAWMWGGFSLVGLSYNYVNIIAFPLIIGIGVTSGVHILHRYRQQGQKDVASVVRFTGMAIFLSAATTMVGFGSLALAQHRGAVSLGLVLLLGVGSCLITATLFLPALLGLLRSKHSKNQDC